MQVSVSSKHIGLWAFSAIIVAILALVLLGTPEFLRRSSSLTVRVLEMKMFHGKKGAQAPGVPQGILMTVRPLDTGAPAGILKVFVCTSACSDDAPAIDVPKWLKQGETAEFTLRWDKRLRLYAVRDLRPHSSSVTVTGTILRISMLTGNGPSVTAHIKIRTDDGLKRLLISACLEGCSDTAPSVEGAQHLAVGDRVRVEGLRTYTNWIATTRIDRVGIAKSAALPQSCTGLAEGSACAIPNPDRDYEGFVSGICRSATCVCAWDRARISRESLIEATCLAIVSPIDGSGRCGSEFVNGASCTARSGAPGECRYGLCLEAGDALCEVLGGACTGVAR